MKWFMTARSLRRYDSRELIFLLLVVVTITLVPPTISAQRQARWRGTIEQEEGVRVIRNPADPLYGVITFDLRPDLKSESPCVFGAAGGSYPGS